MQKNNRSILFLCPYPYGVAPSQRFRFEQYVSTLQSHGYSVTIHPFLTLTGWNILYTPGNLPRKVLAIVTGFARRFALLLRAVPAADQVFIHREATPLGPPVVEFIIARILRKKIIYDFDDAIWLPNTSEANWFAARVKWHSKVKSICRWSRVISVGNGYLENFARSFSKRVVINPTTVDTELVHNPQLHKRQMDPKVVTLGWTGSHSTLGYLKGIEPVLVELEKKHSSKIRFLVIADRRPLLDIQNVDFVPWSKDQEIKDLLKIDIGIMPLADDAWSKGKCGLKALQYMALNIPTVASPVGVNPSIIDHAVNGYLCDTLESWIAHLDKLVLDAALRKKLGEAGRQKVLSSYSVESNRSNFLSLFE